MHLKKEVGLVYVVDILLLKLIQRFTKTRKAFIDDLLVHVVTLSKAPVRADVVVLLERL